MAVLELSTESATPVATQWTNAITAAAASGDVIRLMRRSDEAQAFFDLGLSTFRSFGAKQIDVEGEGWYPGIATERSDWHHLADVPVRLRAKFSFSNSASAGSVFRGFAHDGLGSGITAAGAGLFNVDGIEWWDCRLSNRDTTDDGFGSSGTGVIHHQHGTTVAVLDPVYLRNRMCWIGGFDTYGKNHDHAIYAKTTRGLIVRENLAYLCTGWIVHGYTDCDQSEFEDNTVDRCFGAFVVSAGTSDSIDGLYRESAQNAARRNIIANPDGGPEHGLSAPSVMAMLDHDSTLATAGPNVYTDNALWQGTGTGLLVRTGGSAGRWQDGGGNTTGNEPIWLDAPNGDYRQDEDSETNDRGVPALRYDVWSASDPDPDPDPDPGSSPEPPPVLVGRPRAISARGRRTSTMRGAGSLRGGLVLATPPPGVAEWRFELVGFDGEPLAELRPRNRSVRLVLSAAGAATFALDVLEAAPYAGILIPGQVDLLISRDDRRIYRGPVGGAQGNDLTLSGGQVTFSSVGLFDDPLSDRYIPAGYDPGAMEQTRLAWQLIADAQSKPGGDLGVVAGSLPDSVARVKAWDTATSIAAAIRELGDLDDGFDFAIEPDSAGRYRFDTWAPRRGANRGVVLEAGRNIASISPTWNAGPGRLANEVTATGADQVAVTEQDAASIVAYRLRERHVSAGEADDATVLGDRARGELARDAVVRPTGAVRLLPGAPDATVVALGLGDLVEVDYAAGWATFQGTYRITELLVTLTDGEGDEQITATVEPFDG